MAPEADSAEAEAVTKQPKKSKQPVMELTPKKTALGDTATIKRLMDDAAIAVVLDEEEGHG